MSAAAEPLASIALPAGLECYKRTPEFDERTLPAGLRAAHRTKAGTWGRLCVLEGSVRYVDEVRGASRTLVASEHQIIEPEHTHHLELLGAVRLYVEFHRAGA